MINWRRGQVIVTRNRIAQEGPLDEFLDGLAAKRPPAGAGARRGRVPRSRPGHDPAGPAGSRRARPHAPPESRDRVGRHRRASRTSDVADRFMSSCSDTACSRSSTCPSDSATRTSSMSPRRSQLCRDARPARAQPRPRARLVLRVRGSRSRPTDAPGHAAVAQEAVHRDGPKRLEPDRPLWPAGRSHGHHGLAGCALSLRPSFRPFDAAHRAARGRSHRARALVSAARRNTSY